MAKIMKAMVKRAAESLNTQFAPVDTVSPKAIITVGDDNGNKAVVSKRPDNGNLLIVRLYAEPYGWYVYSYDIAKDSLVHEVVAEINRRLGFLREILSHKDELVDAQAYGLEGEVIWDAMQSMVEGADADTAVCHACNEWDV